MTKLVDTFLCLLDRAELTDGAVQLGDYVVREFPPDELGKLLHGRKDHTPGVNECAWLRELSIYPWAEYRRPAHAPCNDLKRALLACEFMWKLNSDRPWNNFEDLIRLLNLLRPSPCPLRPVRFLFVPAECLQTQAQVHVLTLDRPTFTLADDRETLGPASELYEIRPADAPVYAQLRHELTFLDPAARGRKKPRGGHVAAAMQLFHIAGRNYAQSSMRGEKLVLLLLYDAAIEALFIEAEERGGIEEKLAKLFPRLSRMSARTSSGSCERCFGSGQNLP